MVRPLGEAPGTSSRLRLCKAMGAQRKSFTPSWGENQEGFLENDTSKLRSQIIRSVSQGQRVAALG